MKELDLFFSTFPYYLENKVPMWSRWVYGEKDLTIKVAVPGFDKKDFNLSVVNDQLKLKIKNNDVEKSYNIITRDWNEPYDIERSKASYKNGMLFITVPKQAESVTKIEIS